MATNPQKSIIKLDNDKFFMLLVKELIRIGCVKVTGLGIFRLKHMKSHTRYIPGSKKVEKIKARIKLSFTPTKSIKLKVQRYGKTHKI